MLQRGAPLLLLFGLCGSLAACATVEGPEVLHVPARDYRRAFDAAVEAARAEGLPAGLRDRRAGIIETDARIAPSLLEPWHDDGASFDDRLENTINLQRRRARFEFALTTPPAGEPSQKDTHFSGPDLLGLAQPQVDRTRWDGDLELSVVVWIDRAQHPGIRRNTWTRRATTRTQIIPPDGNGSALPAEFWTTVARDRDIERRLLAAIARALASEPVTEPEPEPVSAASAGVDRAAADPPDTSPGIGGS